MFPASRIQEPGPVLTALLGALLLHGVVALLLGAALQHRPVEPLPETAPIAPVALLVENEPDRAEETRQFVSLPAPDTEERPEEARFFDRYDRRTEIETVNPNDVLVPSPPEAQRPASAARSGSPLGGGSAARVGLRGADTPEDAPVMRPSDPARTAQASGGSSSVEGTAEQATGEGDAGGSGAGSTAGEGDGQRVDLRAFDAMGAGSDLVVRRNDYLELAEGDRTMLNSLRSTYWSFFQRMQERLSAEWRPNTVLRRYDPTGELYGRRDRYTVLAVTLEGDGSLRHAVVVRSSDLDFLDAEAIRAFEATAPFPNVPESLRDESGRVTFRFGFFVDYGGSGRVRRLP